MSTRRWLNPTGFQTYTPMNGSVVMSHDDIQTLVQATSNATIDNLLFGDVTKWLTSLTYYPIKLLDMDDGVDRFLVAGAKDYDSVSVRNGVPYRVWYGFYMGEHYYPQAETFLDYEPYHKVRVWLPYYGYVDVKIADIQGKYMQFRLYVDWQTGMAQYVIGVSDKSITPILDEQHQDWTDSLAYVDDADTRIVNTVEFKLGVEIPISSTKFNDKLRDTVLTTLSNAVKIATSIATATIPVSTSSETSKKTYTHRNPTTGRQVTTRTVKRETESVRYENDVRGRVNTAVDTAQTVIGVLNLQPTVQTSSNSYLNYGLCNSIVITEYSIEPTVDIFNDLDYRHLNGLPLGEVRTIDSLAGYTTFSSVDTTTDFFNSIASPAIPTFSELAEIEQLLMDGVHLKEYYNVKYVLENVDTYPDYNPSMISIAEAKSGKRFKFLLEPYYNYVLPQSIYVENADIYFYSPITGEVVLENIVGDVTIRINALKFIDAFNFEDCTLHETVDDIFYYIKECDILFNHKNILDVATNPLDTDNSTTTHEFDEIRIGTIVSEYGSTGSGVAFKNDDKSIRIHYLDLVEDDYNITPNGQYIEFNTTLVFTKDKSANRDFRWFYISRNLYEEEYHIGDFNDIVSSYDNTIINVNNKLNSVYHILRIISKQNIPIT